MPTNAGPCWMYCLRRQERMGVELVRLGWHRGPAPWINHHGHVEGTSPPWYYWLAVPAGARSRSPNWLCPSPSLSQKAGRKQGFVSTTKNIYSQLCSGARSIYRSFSFTHEFKHYFFCLMAAGTGFPGKVGPGLSSHLVTTNLLAVVEILGR